jgi:hypothetical protein
LSKPFSELIPRMSNFKQYLLIITEGFIDGRGPPDLNKLGYLQISHILTVTHEVIGVLGWTVFILTPKIAIKGLAFTSLTELVHHFDPFSVANGLPRRKEERVVIYDGP